MTPLMKEGYKRPITEKGVWKLDTWFQKCWLEEYQRPKPWLLRALNRSLGGRFWLGGIFKNGNDASQFVGPVILNLLLQSMQEGDPSWNGYIYGFSIFAGVHSLVESGEASQLFSTKPMKMTENINQVEPEYHWISSLNEESTNWSLKCQLIQIGDVRFFNNERGFGSLLKVVLVDKEGERIQATMFNDAIKTFESSLHIGHSYVISNGRIKEAVAKYNVGTTKYEIILDSKSQITETENFGHGQQLVVMAISKAKTVDEYSINSLQPYKKIWTIKVKLVHRFDLKEYIGSKGKGKLLKVIFMDEKVLTIGMRITISGKHYNSLALEPLSWKRRLNIALDIAHGMEYLHSLAHQSFIHRDLKSSNILLDDDFRAKVTDFGLVKHTFEIAPGGKYSVTTRLAGTFGYLAPEYAVTGKITMKADVFSFGVVLMELVTGMMALNEDRSEETLHLASWFHHIESEKEKLKEAVDKSLDNLEQTFQNICTITELAGHCTTREPHQRPEMGHAVNVFGPLVEKWKPMNDDIEESLGIDLGQHLLQMVEGWQAADGTSSSMDLDDSNGSILARPAGFAESFTSADGQ